MNGFSRVVAPLASVGILVGALALAGCSDEANDLTGVASDDTVAAAPGGVRGRPVSKPDPVKSVTNRTEGTFEIGPLPVRIPVDAATMLEATVQLSGTWTGRGVRVATASGIVNEQIHFDTFNGVLTLEHAVEGLPSPLAIGFHAERGGIKTQFDLDAERKPDKGYDFRAHVKTLTVTDPATGAELPWPEAALGALPNVIRIRDGVLVLASAPTDPRGGPMGDDDDSDDVADDDADDGKPPMRPVRAGRFGRMKLGDD